jgi:hypothetical protein
VAPRQKKPDNSQETAAGATPPTGVPDLPKLPRSALIRLQSTGSWTNVFVFAWLKRNDHHFRRSCLRGAVASLPALNGNGFTLVV